MNNRNFEHIDKLFREGLNRSDDNLNYQEADWLKLKGRLDRNEKRKRGVFWLTRLGGVAALILLFFTLRMLLPEDQKQVIQQAEIQENNQKLNAEKIQPVSSAEVKKTISKPESGSHAFLAQNKPNRLANTGKKGRGSNAMEAKNKPSNEHLSPKHFLDRASENRATGNDTTRVENLGVAAASTGKTVNPEGQTAKRADTMKSDEQKRSSAYVPWFTPNERPNELPEIKHQYRKFALSVLAAPDYNGVNKLNNASMGNDFGLLVTYRVSKNWSLSTGGVYGKKIYETGFSNYNPAKNIWDEYYPKTVNADCRILDIPVNISYTFLNRKNTTISIGSGISSYIMLREDYRFSYVEQDPDTPVTYHVVNKNQHWLSVLNFQTTFEQRLNSKISIGLQPYVKIPLGNIGFAGVKLQSLGMAVILNWNFN